MTEEEDLQEMLKKGFVKFKRKPAKTGDAYVFWIPASYIKNGLIDTKIEYDIFIRKHETKKEEKEK